VADDLKLKGPVREIGIVRDSDRHDSFNITIGIAIKTEGKVSYEEAERLSTKFRRVFLGKDVEFVAVSIPCPVCGKIMNSESGLKKHVAMNHPKKVELVNTPKGAASKGKPEKKTRSKKAETPPKAKGSQKKRSTPKSENPVKMANTTKTEEPHTRAKVEVPLLTKPRVKEESKPALVLRLSRSSSSKQQLRGRQLTLV
jgi:glucan-binding YG repeat protein